MGRRNDEYSRRASLWPFRALLSLSFLGAIAGTGYGFLEYAEPAVGVFVGVWAAFAILLVGVLPAGVIAILDAALVGPRSTRTARWRQRARVRAYSLAGGGVGLAVGTAYGFTYHHAFAVGTSIESLLSTGAVAGTTTGLLAGRVCGWLSSTHSRRRAATQASLTWAIAIAAISCMAFAIVGDDKATLMPGALLALIGAGVLPHAVATPNVDLGAIPPPRALDLSRIPPPPAPAPLAPHPSPGPAIPEGGPGEGERGQPGQPARPGPTHI